MTDESRTSFQASKSANIIKSLCGIFGVILQQAADIYYQSDTSVLIEDGVADLQCRSDKYLATIIWEEHLETEK